MPKFPASDVHAAQTDHRVPRLVSREKPETSHMLPAGKVEVAIFEEPGASVDGKEGDRARGIFIAERAAAGNASGDARTAVELLSPIVKLSPHDVEGLYLLGRAYLQLGRPQNAVRTWEEVLAIQPRHEDVLEALAAHYAEAHDLAAARRYYERLIEVNPGRSEYHGRLANVLGQLGEVPQAIAAAERCLELNPSLNQAHGWLAEVCRTMGDEERAAYHDAKLKQFQSLIKVKR